ncbi:Glycosyl hydrolase 20 catalytic domain family protein [Acanthocheilonema viteae]
MLGSQKNLDQINPFREKIVHFDLKGAPPTLKYYTEIFPLLKEMRVDGILMEYEDMFPYWNELSVLKREISYDGTIIKAILELAFNNSLEVIPLVQTFGHMEFVLKHSKYSIYREDMLKHDTICPSDKGSWHLITEMLAQIRSMHPNAKRIHIGADEAYTIGKDNRCVNRLIGNLNFSLDRLKLDHISRVAKYARNELGFVEVLVWNDMFGDIDAALLKEYQMGELFVPVVWGYAVDVNKLNYFPANMFKRYSQVFSKMMFASAFKGANGQNELFCYIRRYLATQQSYVRLYEKEKKDILNCRNTIAKRSEKNAVTIAGSKNRSDAISLEMMFTNCSFPGSKIYDEVANLLRYVTGEKQPITILQKTRENIDVLLRPYFYEESVNEIVTELMNYVIFRIKLFES